MYSYRPPHITFITPGTNLLKIKYIQVPTIIVITGLIKYTTKNESPTIGILYKSLDICESNVICMAYIKNTDFDIFD